MDSSGFTTFTCGDKDFVIMTVDAFNKLQKQIIEGYLEEQEQLRVKQVREKRQHIMAESRKIYKEQAQKRYEEILECCLLGYHVESIKILIGVTHATVYNALNSFSADDIKRVYKENLEGKSLITSEDIQKFIALDCNYKRYRKYLGKRCACLPDDIESNPEFWGEFVKVSENLLKEVKENAQV